MRDTIERVRPRAVLIEGPADMNARLDELAMQRSLPIAIFSYYRHEDRTHASWSPFCDYSPEWVALQHGLAIGAEVRFIDLPAWAVPFRGVQNRYADRPRLRYVERLAEKLGADGLDALWDHLFEQPLEPQALQERMLSYFRALRVAEGDEGESHLEGDRERERFMAGHIAQALAHTRGDVLVVCGGYHLPYLERAWESLPPELPETPRPEGGARHGSYLVPYSFLRLDRFTGYQSGMPSPGFYQALWQEGAERACEAMLERIAKRLRARKQNVSAADLIAVETMARGLMRLRGHDVMARSDLLDAIAAALLKDALDVPLPWTERGPLRAGTDPTLVEVLAALTGEREGTLADGTPRPPLDADVREQLERFDVAPTGTPRAITLDLTVPHELDKSRVLHRLRLLALPGFVRAGEQDLHESWTIGRSPDLDAAVIEASAYGPTLEAATVSKLEESLLSIAGDVSALAALLLDALRAGLIVLADRALRGVELAIGHESRLDRLGAALATLLAIYRHDTLRGGAGGASFGAVIGSMVTRAIWLFEGMHGPEAQANPNEIRAIVAIRDAIKHAGRTLPIDPVMVRDVMERRAVDPDAPPAHRGAGLGYLWSMGAFDSEEQARERAVLALRGSSRPSVMGEFLTGLFALAREEVVAARELVEAIDAIVLAMPLDDLLIALPSLRLSFTFFPPRERDAIARLVLSIHGREDVSVRDLRRTIVSPETVAAGLALEKRIDGAMARYGLAPGAAPATTPDPPRDAKEAP